MPAVRVPATSANLGPGFDCFALALGWYDQYAAEPSDEWCITVSGVAEGEIPADETSRVAVSMKRAFELAGEPDRAAKVECMTRVPPGRGLGSSAGATVAGIMLANSLADSPFPEQEILGLAADIEGHADNVASALFGGFTLSWYENEGPRATRLEPTTGLATVVVVSDAVLDTVAARDLIPERVPREDAAFNAARSGLLAAGLALGRADLAAAGLDDRLHEPYRAEVVTDLETVTRGLVSAGADGAVLSGAGPTVVGILLDTDDSAALRRAVDTAERATRILKDIPDRRTPVAIPVDRRGAVIV